jgi:hypothetical protein
VELTELTNCLSWASKACTKDMLKLRVGSGGWEEVAVVVLEILRKGSGVVNCVDTA